MGRASQRYQEDLKLPKSTINDIWKRYKETGGTNTRQRPGWSALSNSRQDRTLVRMSLQDRLLTAPQLQVAWKDTCDVSVSMTTVKSRLASAGLNRRIARLCVSA